MAPQTASNPADPPAAAAIGPKSVATVRKRKQPQDTPEGCRLRADADRSQAALAATEPGRLRLEHSAASWIERAEMLERLETRFLARAGRGRT